MSQLFLHLLNLSISGSYLVLAVVLLRLILKKAPRWVSPLLWGLVALRLVMPVSLESRVSMIPDPEPVSRAVIEEYIPQYEFATFADRQVNEAMAGEEYPVVQTHALSATQWLSGVWLAGAAAMGIYTLVSFLNLRRRLRGALPQEGRVYRSRAVDSPFVLGLFRPRIYLPTGLGEEEAAYVIAHEQAHIRRLDHIWKPLGFCLLSIHWFNPLMWLAYILLCRDIELACDEKVIRQLGRDDRADYSQALLSCSVRRRSIAACPLAFGEVGVKQRVKSVLNYKKPGFWIVMAAVAAGIVVAVCFLTDPRTLDTRVYQVEDVLYQTSPQPEEVEGQLPRLSYAVSDSLGLYVRAPGEDWQFLGQLEPQSETWETVLEKAPKWQDSTPMEITESYACWPEEDSGYYVLKTPKDTLIALAWKQEWGEIRLSYLASLTETGETMENRKLTLADVRRLAEKGEDLSWRDFEDFPSEEVGSGLYIRHYELEEENFFLRLTGRNTREKPQAISLGCKAEDNSQVDIRRGDVDAFVKRHRDAVDWLANNHWGLCLSADQVTPTGARIQLWIRNAELGSVPTVYVQDGYLLQTKNDQGHWVDMPTVRDHRWPEDSWEPFDNSVQQIDWEWLYGSLPDGEYRLGRWVRVEQPEHTQEQFFLWEEFGLYTEGRTALTADKLMELLDDPENLSWEDLEGYPYRVSRLPDSFADNQKYSRIYDLPGPLTLVVKGSGPDEPPYMLMTECAEDGDIQWSYLQIRSGIRDIDVGEAVRQEGKSLQEFIKLHNRPRPDENTNHWGFTFAVEEAGPGGATVYFASDPPYESLVQLSEQYQLYRFAQGTWLRLDPLPGQEWGTEYFRTARDGSLTVDWEERYGLLPEGRYRLEKNVRAYMVEEERNVIWPPNSVFDEFTVGSAETPTVKETTRFTPLEALPEAYTPEKAELDGCVVVKDGEPLAGLNLLESFSKQTDRGEKAHVRLASFYDNAHFVQDLTFDGENYTLRWLEEGKEIVKTYRFLMDYVITSWDQKGASFQTERHFVLTNDDSLTWEDIRRSEISSASTDLIDHMSLLSQSSSHPGNPVLPEKLRYTELNLNGGDALLRIAGSEKLTALRELFANARVLGYDPGSHSAGSGLSLLLSFQEDFRDRETVIVELDPESSICRIGGEYCRYGDGQEGIFRLWEALGIEKWPDEVYELYPNAPGNGQ